MARTVVVTGRLDGLKDKLIELGLEVEELLDGLEDEPVELRLKVEEVVVYENVSTKQSCPCQTTNRCCDER